MPTTGGIEITTAAAFQCRFPTTNDCVGCSQVVWNAQTNDQAFRTGGPGYDRNESIFACQGKSLARKGDWPPPAPSPAP